MIAANAISSQVLPDNRNFSRLKSACVSSLKRLSGNDWTDYNESDPGITIVDQLCYALTELGYCSNFSIEDILSQADGEIKFENQFFTPEQILSCSPITISDYQKFIIDSAKQIKNAYIEHDLSSKSYAVKLQLNKDAGTASIEEKVSHRKNIKSLEQSIFHLLNERRNIGECFASVKVLSSENISLFGHIYIQSDISESQLSSKIVTALDNYVCPPVRRLGLQEMRALAYSEDEIFNGPRLVNGWIPDEDLITKKKKVISIDEISELLTGISGIVRVENLAFESGKPQIQVKPDSVAALNIESLTFSSDGNTKSKTKISKTKLDISNIQAAHQSERIGAKVDVQTSKPKGEYRDLSNYYSIQNTFPSFYGIGFDSLQANAPIHRVAQSRQLKGYLMIFDQLLANQFSQLANVSKLFSFGLQQDAKGPAEKEYASIPQQLFSPTYFCQPLYQVPEVRPLLSGNDDYYYGDVMDQQSSKMQDHLSWRKFQNDPFNPYIKGLHDCMESDVGRDRRREQMLNHLLARHGESALFYDQQIDEALWFGSVIKTRIILKSLLLQNYAAVSYNRVKAFSYLAAKRVGTPGRYSLNQEAVWQLTQDEEARSPLHGLRAFVGKGFRLKQDLLSEFKRKFNHPLSRAQEAKILLLIADRNHRITKSSKQANYRDGQLLIEALESRSKVQNKDFNNYSSLELVQELILQLTNKYQELTQILLHLLASEKFSKWLPKENPKKDYTCLIAGVKVSVQGSQNSSHNPDVNIISIGGTSVLKIQHKSRVDIKCYQEHFDQLYWLSNHRLACVLIESVLLTLSINYKRHKNTEIYQSNVCKVLFPDYVLVINESAFRSKLLNLAYQHIPAHVEPDIQMMSYSELNDIIPVFCKWQNLLTKQKKYWTNSDSEVATKLASLLGLKQETPR